MSTFPALPKTMFIVFEGPDGCGKTTQLNKFVATLRERYPERRIITTRLPGGTPFGEEIRNLTKHYTGRLNVHAELLAMCAGYAQVVDSIIAPAEVTETIVVCDRFFLSGLAYQIYGKMMMPVQVLENGYNQQYMKASAMIEASLGRLFVENGVAMMHYYLPDLTFYFQVPFEELQRRKQQRKAGTDRFEGDLVYDARVAAAYRFAAANDPKHYASGTVRTINGLGTEDEVYERMMTVFDTTLPDIVRSRGLMRSPGDAVTAHPDYEALTQ